MNDMISANVDVMPYFISTGGNYQGGKQQRGGGGRQPRHQPY